MSYRRPKAPPAPAGTITIERDGAEFDVTVFAIEPLIGCYGIECEYDLTPAEEDAARDAIGYAMDADPAIRAYRDELDESWPQRQIE